MIIKPYIDQKNSGISRFPVDLFSQKRLLKINLSKNQIKIIPHEIKVLKNIEVLDLSNNHINQLFANLFTLSKLKFLILNNNHITSVPRQVLNLKKLQKLHLSGNKLKGLNPAIGSMTELKELNISKNEIGSFPESIFQLKKLETLWIGGNPMTSFPVDRILNELPKLKRLYCYNKVLNADATDANYIKLCSVRGNSIKYLKTLNSSTKPTSNLKIRIFISYAHQNKDWFEKVDLNLKALKFDNDDIETWSDENIIAGEQWNEKIEEAIQQSRIHILLISTEFLASEFIRTKELPAILKQERDVGTKILCLILSHCRFLKNKELSIFQTINSPDNPLESMDEPDQNIFLTKMTEVIESLIK